MGIDNLIPEEKEKKRKQIIIEDDIKRDTEAEGYVLGVIVGDGNVHKRLLELQTVDKDFAVEYTKKLCELFNLNWDGFDSDETDVGITYQEVNNGNRQDIWRIKKGISRVKEYVDKYQNLEFENEEILNKPDEFKVGFTRGLWDSEGSVRENRGLRFANSIEQVRELYISLIVDIVRCDCGYYGPSRDDISVGKEYNYENSSRNKNVYIPKQYNELFLDKINPSIQRKRDKLKETIK